MPIFDAIADQFDRFRALPDGVPEAVRASLRDGAGTPPGRLLEIGAGTGRLGQAFVAAGDDYIGTDPSRPMLERFASKRGGPDNRPPRLVQADGLSLPFPDGAFDAVLLFAVLSGIPRWRELLTEARRVLRPGGTLVLGRRGRPVGGVDARMKDQLTSILTAMGLDARRPGAGRDDARDWLAHEAERRVCVTAARWESHRSPRDFLARHPTGARFSSLPESSRDEAMSRLSEWALSTFGRLETSFCEEDFIELDFYTFAC